MVLRKLLEEDSSFEITTNVTTSTKVTTSPRKLFGHSNSLAVLQVLDDHGLVQYKISTNQNIRLRVKAITTPGSSFLLDHFVFAI